MGGRDDVCGGSTDWGGGHGHRGRVAGVADLLAGLGDIGMGGGFLGDLGFGATLDGIMTAIGLGLVAVGALGLATAFGLWSGRNWAWLIARLWASLCIIAGIVGVGLSLLSDRS